MEFSISNVAKHLASHLSGYLPGVTFYENPNQQGSAMPCMFLQQRSAKIEKRMAGRFLRSISLDLTYLEDYNLPDLQERYEAAAEILDQCMDTFSYGDDLIRALNRSWNIDLDALHYKFDIKVWVKLADDGTPMQDLDVNESVEE